jgi:O-antigen ligase
LQLVPIDASGWRPLSVAPASTVYAIALVMTALVFFWTARRCCTGGLALRIVCAIALTGLVVALLAIGLRSAGTTGLVYGRWRTLHKDAHPFGPFVNRNHFATWAVMACSMAAGYVMAVGSRGAARPGAAGWIVASLKWLGTPSAWVSAAGLVMVVALVISTSRSGAIGFCAALACGAWLGRGRMTRRTVAVGVLALVASAALVASYANTGPLVSRLNEAWVGGATERRPVWRETNRVIRDFPLTGTGLGTYETAMLVYQQTNKEIRINQAHNQYLQLFADGGILLTVPVAIAIVAFVRLFRLRLAEDTSSSAWLRIGGGAAMLAIAVQSLWETGLRIPANGLLFAAAAAVAVHRPERTRSALPHDGHADGLPSEALRFGAALHE